MTKVKMPEKDLFDGTTVSPSGKYKASINGYSEAKLKQYGDDRAREALEMAAREIGSEGQSGSYLSKRVRELAKEIK